MSYFGCSKPLATLVLPFFLSLSAAGQSRLPPVIHAETNLVLVPAVVTDKDYRPVYDLAPEQFELQVDGQPTPLRNVWKESGPVSVVLVLDASKSMRSTLARSKEALNGFLRLAQTGDEYALVLCREVASLAVPFTTDLNSLSQGFLSVAAEGSTPLFDAIDLGVDVSRKSKNSNRAILVITDGADTHSRTNFKALRSKVQEASVPVHVLEFWDNRPYDNLEPQPLKELTEMSGGVHFDDVSPKRFAEYFADMDMHQRYMLAFQPERVLHDNKQHSLKVKIRGLAANKQRVFWRHSFADSEATIQ